jgi:hypothetical protein
MANAKESSLAPDSPKNSSGERGGLRGKLTQASKQITSSRLGFVAIAAVGILAIAAVGVLGTSHLLALNAEAELTSSELQEHKDLVSQKSDLESRAKACAEFVAKEIEFMETFKGALGVIGPQTANMWHSGIRNVDYGAYMDAMYSVRDLTAGMDALDASTCGATS